MPKPKEAKSIDENWDLEPAGRSQAGMDVLQPTTGSNWVEWGREEREANILHTYLCSRMSFMTATEHFLINIM